MTTAEAIAKAQDTAKWARMKAAICDGSEAGRVTAAAWREAAEAIEVLIQKAQAHCD